MDTVPFLLTPLRIAQIDRQVISPTIIDLRLSEKVDIKQSYNLSIRRPDSKKFLLINCEKCVVQFRRK